MKAFVRVAVVGAALLLGALVPVAVPAQQNAKTPLTSVAPSTESGTVTVQGTSAGILVTIVMHGEKGNQRQPAHLHRGACGSFGAQLISFRDVTNGKSVTTVPKPTWVAAANAGPVSIDVHKSNMAYNTILACGNLK